MSSSSSSSLSLPPDEGPRQQKHAAFKVKNEVYTSLKFKKVKLEALKYFKRLHRLMATKKKKQPEGEDMGFPSLAAYPSDDEDEELSDESDLDAYEFQRSVRTKLQQIKVRG